MGWTGSGVQVIAKRIRGVFCDDALYKLTFTLHYITLPVFKNSPPGSVLWHQNGGYDTRVFLSGDGFNLLRSPT